MNGADGTVGLWLAVVASGLYHGLSPGMGWPLVVSAGLFERREAALIRALGPLATGHFLAMLVLVLPFAFLLSLLTWRREVQIGAGLLVLGFGLFRLIDRRHPRALARIRPTQLGLWSFLVALAHGSGLMLVPLYLGLCGIGEAAELGAGPAVAADLATALLVAGVHAGAMIAAGGLVAWLVYRYLGLAFLRRSWLNLDATWAASLVLVGTLSVAVAIAHDG